MALFGKYEERPPRPRGARVPAGGAGRPEESGTAEPAGVQAHLARGSRVEGKLHFDGSVRIDGEVEGEVEAQDTVVVGESAVLVARVTAGAVVAMGKVTGDITARERVELRAPCRLSGNIATPTLVIQDGVFFEGHCAMASADAAVEKGKNEKRIAVVPEKEKADRDGLQPSLTQ